MNESTDPEPATTEPDRAEPTPKRDLSQWIGAVTVLSGVGLVVLSSFGLVVIDDSTVRLLLLFGSVLVVGREATARIR